LRTLFPRDTLSNSPTPASDVTIAEPPALMNGSTMPVKGSNPVTTPTLIKASNVIQQVTPDARRAANGS
jgi:hypothetical protein